MAKRLSAKAKLSDKLRAGGKNPKMGIKDYRDLIAVLDRLENRRNMKLIVRYLGVAIEDELISEKEMTNILVLLKDESWSGEFYFYEACIKEFTCNRCKRYFAAASPACFTFSKKPFCIRCLTEEEKKNPSPYYTKYLSTKEPEEINQAVSNGRSRLLDELNGTKFSREDDDDMGGGVFDPFGEDFA